MIQLLRLKVRLCIKDNDSDELLETLLLEAREYILGYTKRSETQWLASFDNVQIQIAMINYGRMGAEGVQRRSEGGISTAFLGVSDYPESVVKSLDPYRLVKGI